MLHLLCVAVASQAPPTEQAPWLAAYFTAGMLVFALGERVVVNPVQLTAATVLLGVVVWSGELRALGGLPITYLLLAAGAGLPPAVFSRTDLSYGTYLYAFPVQQLVAIVGAGASSTWGFAALSVVGTIPLALLSWFGIEKPALAWSARQDRALADPSRVQVGERLRRHKVVVGVLGAPKGSAVI